MEAVANTRHVPQLIATGEYDAAMELRGGSFMEASRILAELVEPSRIDAPEESKRIAIVHAGGLAPGMNAAARAAVRLGISRGHTMLGIRNGFPGLRDGEVDELEWSDVESWLPEGGAELGVRRTVPSLDELYRRLLTLFVDTHRLDGARLHELVDQRRFDEAGALAHRMRGSSATLGLVDVETACAALEHGLDGPDGPALAGELAQDVEQALRDTLDRLTQALIPS
jgi:6-phosphofructokinase 1